MLALISLIAFSDLSRSVYAKSYWLLMRYQSLDGGVALQTLEMESIEQCEVTGLKFMSSQKIYPHAGDSYRRGFECLEAK